MNNTHQPEEAKEVPPGPPLLTIWFRPRETIHDLVEVSPKKWVDVIVMLISAFQAFIQVMSVPRALPLPKYAVIPTALIAGALIGYCLFRFVAWVYTMVGNWFGGVAEGEQVRAAIAWGQVPNFLSYAVWFAGYFCAQAGIFPQGPGLLFYGATSTVFAMWSFVITCHTLGEVNQFSAWKSFFVMFVSSFIIVIPFVLAAVVLPGIVRFKGPLSYSAKKPALHSVMDTMAPKEMALVSQNEAGAQIKTMVKFEDLIESGEQIRFKLKDGQEIRAKIVEEQGQDIFLETESGGLINVTKDSILESQREKN